MLEDSGSEGGGKSSAPVRVRWEEEERALEFRCWRTSSKSAIKSTNPCMEVLGIFRKWKIPPVTPAGEWDQGWNRHLAVIRENECRDEWNSERQLTQSFTMVFQMVCTIPFTVLDRGRQEATNPGMDVHSLLLLQRCTRAEEEGKEVTS